MTLGKRKVTGREENGDGGFAECQDGRYSAKFSIF
jgi:hypothetical protein